MENTKKLHGHIKESSDDCQLELFIDAVKISEANIFNNRIKLPGIECKKEALLKLILYNFPEEYKRSDHLNMNLKDKQKFYFFFKEKLEKIFYNNSVYLAFLYDLLNENYKKTYIDLIEENSVEDDLEKNFLKENLIENKKRGLELLSTLIIRFKNALRNENKIIKIQSIIRMYLIKYKCNIIRNYENKKKSLILIQSFLRMIPKKKKFYKLKCKIAEKHAKELEEEEKINEIKSKKRKTTPKKKSPKNRKKSKNSSYKKISIGISDDTVILIQSFFRIILSKNKVIKIRIKENNISKLTRILKEEKLKNIIKVQSIFRMKLIKNLENHSFAIMIQSIYRRILCKRIRQKKSLEKTEKEVGDFFEKRYNEMLNKFNNNEYDTLINKKIPIEYNGIQVPK